MGLFFNTWTEFQQQQYGIKTAFVNAFLVAFAVVLTQYFVSRWIWFGGKAQRGSHPVSLYVVSTAVFFYTWSACVDIFFLTKDFDNFPLSLGYQVATPLVVVGGIPLQLLLYYRARHTRDTDDDVDNEPEEGDRTAARESHSYQALAISSATDIEESPLRLETTDVPPSATRARVDYINNIKIFLTFLVIIHHAGCVVSNESIFAIPIKSRAGNWGDIAVASLLGIDQSYFMNLFFFFSGYFVPESFDRKGPYVFLLERVRRLGIPCLVYGFFLGPFGMVGSQYLLFYKGDEGFPNYVFTNGPQWFILQLIIFNVAYAIACGRDWSPKISCPSLLGFFGIALALALCSGILSMFFPQDDFAFVPLFWNEYPSYVAFFFGGALAQRNRWLEELRERPRWPIYLWAFAAIMALSSFDMAQSFWAKRLCMGMIFGGADAVALGLAVTVFFMDHVDRSYRSTSFFAKSMYTAYILHMAFPLQVATKCWILILEATKSIKYVDENNGKGGFEGIYYYIDSGTLVYLGFLFVASVTLMITWPTAYCIRSIPGFSKVL